MTTARDAAATKATELEARVGAAGTETNAAFEQFKKAQEDRIKALETGITAEKEARAAAERTMAESKFVDELRREAAPFAEDVALDDFVERKIRPYFKTNDQGQFVPHDGDAVRYSVKDVGKPMSVKEFIAEVAIKDPTAGYMLKKSRGAGAPGNNGNSFPGASPFTIKRGAPPAEYERIKNAAEKQGQSLQVID